MKNIIKKSIAAAATAASILAPMATQIGTASAVRIATFSTAATVGSIATLAPSTAHAQKNKRMCARIYGNISSAQGQILQGAKIGIGMEVNKADFVTCSAGQATWTLLTSLPFGLQELAKNVFNQSVGVPGGQGGLYFMATCERFSRDMNANTGDVCLQMTDYKLYTFASLNGRFGMRRL